MARFALEINGSKQTVDADPEMPLALGAPRPAQHDRHEIWLRHRALRSLHCPHRRRSNPLLPDIRRHRGREADRHHRRSCPTWSASSPGSLDRGTSSAMRLLPTRTDHVRRCVAGSQTSPHRCRHRRSHGRQSLSLRHLLPHSQRYPPRCRGDALVSTKPSPPPVKSRPTLSRRTFLATSAAAGGALVVGLTLRGRLHQLPMPLMTPLTHGSASIPTDRSSLF